MTPMTDCPETAELTAFANGELSDEAIERVARHLESCERCWQVIEAAPDDAAFADDVRWAARSDGDAVVDINVPLERLNALLPDYEILSEIGRGGMGIVFKARHLRLDRIVALKVLPALLGVVRPDAVSRFRRESALAARLENTNIVGIHDCGEVDGTLYYAMQYVEGCSLRDVLREIGETGAVEIVVDPASHGSESPGSSQLGASSRINVAYYQQVATWMAEVAEALAYAHESGVIHRDIKPSNLLLDRNRRLMITDFGLARDNTADETTRSRSLVGTARYMAPEQVDRERGTADERVDVYGLGATLYELLALRPMIGATDDAEALKHILHRDPRPPSRYVRQVPKDLETICLKAVEKEVSQRYAGATALADDLRRWLLGMPIRAERPNAMTRMVKFVRRRPAIAIAMLLGVLFLTVGINWLSARETSSAHAMAAAKAEKRAIIAETWSKLRKGQYDEARMLVETALASESADPDFIELQAAFLSQARDNKDVVKILEALLEKNPDRWKPHYALATLYMETPYLGKERNVTRNRAKAEYHRKELERLRPDSDALRIIAAMDEPDHHSAIEMLSDLIDRGQFVGDVLRERLERYRAIGDYASMLLDAERLIARSPLDSFGHDKRGLALLDMGRYAEARDALNRAIELNPQNYVAFSSRAFSHQMLGDLQKAFADANESLRINDTWPSGYAARGNINARLGRMDGAFADFDRALELMPNYVPALIDRSQWHGKMGQFEAVIADCTRAIEIDPNALLAYNNRAVAYMRIGKPHRAIADFSRVVELDPENHRAWRTRGELRAELGEYDAALADYTQAIEIAPEMMGHRFARGSVYFLTGRYEDSLAELNVILQAKPDHPVMLMRRGMTNEMLGRMSESLKDYRVVASTVGPTGEYGRLWARILCALSECPNDPSVTRNAESEQQQDIHISWTESLHRLIEGAATAEDLLELAATDDERAEAHFYIGCTALIDGKNDAATKSFQSCVDLKRTNILETDFARARLEQLKSNTSPQKSRTSAP